MQNRCCVQYFFVNLIRFTWWCNLKDQFRNVLKPQKSGSGGTSKENKRVQWQFYQEMSFMKTVQVTSNMQNHQQTVEGCPLLDLPQPPQLQPVPQQVQAQQDNVPADCRAFYIHGPTSMNYEMTRNLDFNTM